MDVRRGPRRFGGPIVLNPDDVPAFSEPPTGFDVRREDIPHGRVEMVEYDSKTVGTTRKMQVYTPPGYTTEKKYPVLYLLHGIGGDETEWQRFAHPDVLLDNLIAEGKAVPMIVVMPNGRAQRMTAPKAMSSRRHPRSPTSSRTCWRTSSRRSNRDTALMPIARIGPSPDCRWAAASRSILDWRTSIRLPGSVVFLLPRTQGSPQTLFPIRRPRRS